MTSSYHNLDHTFADLFVTLRSRLGLTQAALAEKLGVTDRAIQRWEGGTRYPKVEYLKAFLALCLEQHALPAGQEVEQARSVWKAAHLKVLFDEQWVLTQLAQKAPSSIQAESDGARMPQSIARRIDWGEDVSEVSFYGREIEQTQLTTWIREDRCRLIALLGMGGIGKSALAVTLLHQLAPAFSVAAFRSVRDAIPCEELVTDLIQIVAPEPIADIPANIERRIGLLLELLQMRRCLLVLDNVETLLQEGEHSGQYRVGYEDYRQLLERIGTTQHQSCILLTSREKPSELKPLEGSRTLVRSLHLTGLDENAGEQILVEKQLRGNTETRRQLIDVYSGNPLALKIVAETIHELFEGDIAAFLAEGQLIFQGVRALLAQQFARLTFLEQSVLRWLAIVREPTNVTRLLSLLVTSVPRLQLLEALENLRRRSLVEHGQQRSEFTLQSVVMEFVTDELVKQIATEIQRREPDTLLTYGLSLASAKEYIRQTQERLLLATVLTSLGAVPQRTAIVEQQLHYSLDLLRSLDRDKQGYGPTNITMLLHRLKGDLQGVDLSNYIIREASLQGVQMQDASLHGSFVRASTFTETFGTIVAVAVSNNGAYWAAGNESGDVRVFLGKSKVPLLVLHAHNSLLGIAFSPDGTKLATAGRDLLTKVWHLEHATLLAALHSQSKSAQTVDFSPDGTLLATGALDGTVCIWDLVSFQVLHQFHSFEGEMVKLKWSPDGQLLASAGDNGICLWELQYERIVCTLADSGNTVYGLAFSPDGQFLASGGTDHLIKVWDVHSRVCLTTLEGHTKAVSDVAWSSDGRLLASGGQDATVRLWRTNPVTAYQVLRGHIAAVFSVTFTADGTQLFSGSDDQSVRLWELTSGDCVSLIQGYTPVCYSMAWSPRENIIACGTNDANVTLWNATRERPLRVLQGHTRTIYSTAWSPDGQVLATGGDDQTIRFWHTNTGECLFVLHKCADIVYRMAWNPNGHLLAVGGYYDKTIRVLDVENQQYSWIQKDLPASLQALIWSPDGTLLASGSQDATARLWNAKDGVLFKVFRNHTDTVYGIAWSPDGKQLACCAGTEVVLWDIASEKHIHTLACSTRVFVVAWSSSGNRLLVGERGGAISWFETARWTCLAIRKEHEDDIKSISISPDGSNVASVDIYGTIIIWDMEHMAPLRTLRPDRPYERLDITGIQGITEAQKAILHALGAVGN